MEAIISKLILKIMLRNTKLFKNYNRTLISNVNMVKYGLNIETTYKNIYLGEKKFDPKSYHSLSTAKVA